MLLHRKNSCLGYIQLAIIQKSIFWSLLGTQPDTASWLFYRDVRYSGHPWDITSWLWYRGGLLIHCIAIWDITKCACYNLLVWWNLYKLWLFTNNTIFVTHYNVFFSFPLSISYRINMFSAIMQSVNTLHLWTITPTLYS